MRNIIKPFSTSSSSSTSSASISYIQSNILSTVVLAIIGIGSLIVLVPLFSFHVSTHQKMAHLPNIPHHGNNSSMLRPFHGASSDHYYYPLNLIKNQQKGDYYDEKLKKIESSLGSVRVFLKEIASASIHHQNSSATHDDPDYYIPNGQIYRNPYLFHRYVYFFFSF
ncbi:hypothetical protein MKW94_012154 [Papaver nudicaule]|uniref:Uncharacterized protein n=1 Tax=Papaver nudicaule TaxID=74823 RepID=A0AA41VRM3_PAPNU|nr:hypothetical protein [Papaver nudicaule]